MTDNPFKQIDAAREAEQFMQRLGRAIGALASIGPVEIGSTPKDEVFREDKVVLYRYRPFDAAQDGPFDLAQDRRFDPAHGGAFDVAQSRRSGPVSQRIGTPLLICYALVNRPYMMDLQPDRSLIRGLLSQGVDVYLVDWGYPDGADRYLGMEDYVLRYLSNCIDAVCARSGEPNVNLLGVCQGGTLSVCYAALSPERVRNLITMVTPVDFRTPENLLTKWCEHVDIDALVATTGNVPGDMLNALFLSLMPFRLTSQKYVGLLDQIDDPKALENFLRMEKWIFDSPDQPGEMFRQFLTWFIKENRLVRGTLQLGGQRVELDRITMPVMNLYALQDHLVPPSASRPLEALVGTDDYTSYEFPGGHIGIYVSSSAQREVPSRIGKWLRERDS